MTQNAVSRRRRAKHPGNGIRLHVPDGVWALTLDYVRDFAKYESERLLLWSGVIDATGEALVRTVIAPVHEPLGPRVVVDSRTWRGVLEALRRQDQMLLAQVHSHPGDAFHSHGDDERPAEHSDGFLSIVIPNYGRGVQRPADCAVFEYVITGSGGDFYEVPSRDIPRRVLIEHEAVEAGSP